MSQLCQVRIDEKSCGLAMHITNLASPIADQYVAAAISGN